jgi:hypothetical protein
MNPDDFVRQTSRPPVRVPLRGPDVDELTVDRIEVAINTTGANPENDSDEWHAADSYEDRVVGHLVGPGSAHGVLPKGANAVFVRWDAGAPSNSPAPVLFAGWIHVK